MTLTVSDLTFRYNTAQQCHYHFRLANGQRTGLIGRNGAGKSTLLKLIAGELTAETGEISITGSTLSKQPEHYFSKLGYVPDQFPDDNRYRVSDFLLLALACKSSSLTIDELTVDKRLSHLKINELLPLTLNRLSLGQKQRVSLTQALIDHPECLIMDEPLNGLDPTQQQQFWQTLSQQPDNQCALIASHHLADLSEHCQRLLFIDNHCIVLDINLTSVLYMAINNKALSQADVTDTDFLLHNKIIGFQSEHQLTQYLSSHQSDTLFSGATLAVLNELFRYQASGEWQW